jgi:hypothetical protein
MDHFEKQRKKELGKRLAAWKEAFEARVGREPTEADIEDDAEMRDVYSEYLQLQQQLAAAAVAAGGAEGADGAVGAAVAAASPQSAGGAADKRRKAIAKELDRWRKAWRAQMGADPSAADMRGDNTVRHLLDELAALDAKSAAAAAEGSAATENAPGSTEDGPAANGA